MNKKRKAQVIVLMSQQLPAPYVEEWNARRQLKLEEAAVLHAATKEREAVDAYVLAVDSGVSLFTRGVLYAQMRWYQMGRVMAMYYFQEAHAEYQRCYGRIEAVAKLN